MYACMDYDPKQRPSAKQIYDALAAPALRAGQPQPPSQAAGAATQPGLEQQAGSGAPPAPPENGSRGVEQATAAREADAEEGLGVLPELPSSGDGGPAAQKRPMPTPLGRATLPIKSPFAE